MTLHLDMGSAAACGAPLHKHAGDQIVGHHAVDCGRCQRTAAYKAAAKQAAATPSFAPGDRVTSPYGDGVVVSAWDRSRTEVKFDGGWQSITDNSGLKAL